jgi:hypothetical protein
MRSTGKRMRCCASARPLRHLLDCVVTGHVLQTFVLIIPNTCFAVKLYNPSLMPRGDSFCRASR